MSKQREALLKAYDALAHIYKFSHMAIDAIDESEALAEPEKTNQCGETCERAKLCAVCAKELAEPEQQPVARIRTWTTYSGRHADLLDWEDGITLLPQGEHLLYTSPLARKPLTDEEINSLRHIIDWTAEWSYSKFARAIERAHGIGGE